MGEFQLNHTPILSYVAHFGVHEQNVDTEGNESDIFAPVT